MREYLISCGSSFINIFLFEFRFGDGNIGSRTILNVFSINSGIILESNGLSVSRQGLVLHSININLKFWSSMKSYPRISNEFNNLSGSIFMNEARKESYIKRFIWGTICSTTSIPKFGSYWFKYL